MKTIPLPRRQAPEMLRVKQKLRPEHISDVRGETKRRVLAAKTLDGVERGAKIAITAGSRGMGGFTELLAGIVDAVKSREAEPFIIPAMGSHGGATPDGQIEILRRLGVTDESVGAVVRATMDTHALGKSSTGAVAHLDDIAAEADGIIVLGRVKTHPENTQGIASGLLKMVTVGLGKQIGAQEAHSHSLWPSVEAVPMITMVKANILCGVAVVENAFREPVEIEVVEPKYEAFREADKRLLEIAKQHFASIPFSQLDLLVIDEIGKNISGTGMDLNVVGKWRMEGGERDPDFRRIAVLSLTDASLGNGLGIGLADFTTERFAKEFDPAVTYVNLLTATEPGAMNSREGLVPIALPSDRDAIEVALDSALAGHNPRVCRIRNTALLDEFWVSPALRDEVLSSDKLRIEEEAKPMEFDSKGDLF